MSIKNQRTVYLKGLPSTCWCDGKEVKDLVIHEALLFDTMAEPLTVMIEGIALFEYYMEERGGKRLPFFYTDVDLDDMTVTVFKEFRTPGHPAEPVGAVYKGTLPIVPPIVDTADTLADVDGNVVLVSALYGVEGWEFETNKPHVMAFINTSKLLADVEKLFIRRAKNMHYGNYTSAVAAPGYPILGTFEFLETYTLFSTNPIHTETTP